MAEAEPMTTTTITPTAQQLEFLAEHLPAPPARVLDAGCGRGELSAALRDRGYDVTGIDVDPQAVAVAQAAGAPVIKADITEYRDRPFDAVLFSLSLHHVDRLDAAVARTEALLEPGGILIADEFTWERADLVTATWFYDIATLLAAGGPGEWSGPAEPVDQPLQRWIRRHRDDDPMHTGAAMINAIAARFDLCESVRVPYLHRYLGGWLPDDATGRRLRTALYDIERRRVADRGLAPVGLQLVARPAAAERTYNLSAMHQYKIVDVFTDTPLEGNPAAVYTDGQGIPSERMQQVAREMNLSETVFVLPAEAGGDARIRIFTPTRELPFAGHPTLGTAIVLGEPTQLETIRLETGAGVVPVELERRDGRVVAGRMRQPIPTWQAYDRTDELLAAIGVGASGLPVEVYVNGPRHVYVELDDEDAVAALKPDLARLKTHDAGVNCFAGSGTKWKTRMFGAAMGVPEDPATGSSAGPLAVHLARHGRIDFGQEIEIRQGAEIGRPSRLYARAAGHGDQIDRVEVAGAAVVVADGRLHV
jgi:trans-2,3-dihydro-3-hydroxyanthranilate isomerase